MKVVYYFLLLTFAMLTPAESFAITSSKATQQTFAVAHKKSEAKAKKSTWICLYFAVGFIGLAEILKVVGVASGVLAACYILGLIACILAIGTLFKD